MLLNDDRAAKHVRARRGQPQQQTGHDGGHEEEGYQEAVAGTQLPVVSKPIDPALCLDHLLLKSAHAELATDHRMAGLRRVFDHSRLLADDSSVCRAVARAASFLSSLAIYGAVARLGGDVVRGRTGHAAVAKRTTLPSRLGLGSGSFAVRLRAVCLFAILEEFQCEATRWIAGSSWRKSPAAAGDRWNPVARAASGVPGASVRDAGVERRDRGRGVLGSDGVRSAHRGGDDPDGGRGVGEKVWRDLPSVSQLRAGGSAKSVLTTPAIIRSN